MCGSAMFTTVMSRLIMSGADSMMIRATPGWPRVRDEPGRRCATAGDREGEEGTVVSWKWSTGMRRGSLRIMRSSTPITIRRQAPLSKLINGPTAGQGEAGQGEAALFKAGLVEARLCEARWSG